MHARATVIVIPLAAAGLVLAGCSSDSGGSGSAASSETTMVMSSTATPSASGDIVISGYAFAVPAKVAPGQKITIRNDDSVEHSVTADAGDAFDVDVDAGKTATLTVPAAAGSYAFHCEYHPKMKGTLAVG